MEDNKPIDGAEYISLEDAKRLKLPYFEGLAAGFPSPADGTTPTIENQQQECQHDGRGGNQNV